MIKVMVFVGIEGKWKFCFGHEESDLTVREAVDQRRVERSEKRVVEREG